MNTQRDELAQMTAGADTLAWDIFRTDNSKAPIEELQQDFPARAEYAIHIAKGLRDLGYSKPRVIETTEELDTLVSHIKVRARVLHDHVVRPDDEWDFHEWYRVGNEVKADKNGKPNGRILSADWALVRCNNTDCPAEALINMVDILTALPAAPEGNAS